MLYTKYLDRLSPYLGDNPPNPQPIQISQIERNELGQTAAGRVLATNPGNNFVNLFNAVTHNIYDDAQWQWNPSASGSYTVAKAMSALDGSRKDGECKILSAVLLGLWMFPPPFGLGQRGAALFRFTNNNPNDGFISHHPVAGVRGLKPNIMHPFGRPDDLTTRQPLYQWGDHKVVLYQDVYYDPSYKATYNSPDEMVCMEFTEQHASVADVYGVRITQSNHAKGWLLNQVMYMRFDLHGGGWKGPYRAVSGD